MIALADARAMPLADACVQTVITSPPYWGLRSYGTTPLTWGGVVGCEHDWGDIVPGSNRGGSGPNRKQGSAMEYARDAQRGNWCLRCGAWRGELGLEPTPDLYVAHLVEVFRELRRVLRPDGTVWMVIGDSYASGEVGRHDRSNTYEGEYQRATRQGPRQQMRLQTDLKPKDLCGIPWRVAFALQADGWWLRQDIIWAKPNPMPESVTDRCTRSHEYVFLLTKAARYYYDADAIAEPSVGEPPIPRMRLHDGLKIAVSENKLTGYRRKTQETRSLGTPADGYRNRRSVWTVSTHPFREAHFATFPPKLVEPMVLAGSRAGDLVLDPFAGSGTVGVVCQQHNRRFLGLDLRPDYCQMAQRRLEGCP